MTVMEISAVDGVNAVPVFEKSTVSVSVTELPVENDSTDFTNILEALRYAAAHTTEGILAYGADVSTPSAARTFSYKDLLQLAVSNAAKLQQKVASKVQPGSVVIVHFDNALESVIWYWSVLLTGAIPCMAGPGMFSQDPVAQKKHLEHLYKTLDGPLCITSQSLLGPFGLQAGDKRIETLTIEDIAADASCANGVATVFEPSSTDIAALMLTSGSSGNSKAVRLSHHQMLACCRGKVAAANLQPPFSSRPLLSWVGIDHVANLVQCHILAIVSGVTQIQVPSAEIVVDPLQLLNLISRHGVARSFAPNFLLAKLRRTLAAGKTDTLDANVNLEGLFLDTGGEANVVEVCGGLQPLLSKYGAPKDVFKPGFGMTETCAGAIFNHQCPSYDLAEGLEFTCLGKCMPGIQMRITRVDGSETEAAPLEQGSLEVTGDAVFKGYHNNEAATKEAFTSDGWFRTGDLAFIDAQGNMHLCGRTKEVININSIKYLPHELEEALEGAQIPGATPSYFCCFGTQTSAMDTQAVTVLYLPSYNEADDETRFKTQNSISRVISIHTQSSPQIIPLLLEQMPKSTLGKLSRGKLKAALEAGAFAAQKTLNEEGVQRHVQKLRSLPGSPNEEIIISIVKQQLELPEDNEFGAHDSILSTGATSMDVIAIMRLINNHASLELSRPIRLLDILNSPTAHSIAQKFLDGPVEKHEYDPAVLLQPAGDKAPLWLVHPGVGEILVFVNLAHLITERPIYALRAKGFEIGEEPFERLEDVWDAYYASIKKHQPQGPYALAGYSFGAMIAFEVSKRLEANGDEVKYVGSWNLPPHIKSRMRELVWHECVHHLFYFVGLMDEETANTHKPALCKFEAEGRRLEGIRYLRQHCDKDRWDELGLSEEYYLRWVDLASKMQGMAVDYEPTGNVKCMDVFVANPLSHVAKDKKDWIENKLSYWKDFVREGVNFHDVGGAHYTMLNQEYLDTFKATLRAALESRGI